MEVNFLAPEAALRADAHRDLNYVERQLAKTYHGTISYFLKLSATKII